MSPARQPPRRVLMTADTIGGVWTYALDLCRGLADYDVEVVLATMGAPARADQRHDASALGNVLLCESTFRLEWMNSPWDDVRSAGDWLLELEQRFAPDIVHLNGYAHGALPWTAPALAVGHSCVLSWWRAVRNADAPLEWKAYAAAVREGLRAARAVVAPTRWMAAALAEHYGTLPSLQVIPNGRPHALLPELRKKEFFILAIGRLWDEAKNARQLARIAPEVPWPIRIAGDSRAPDGSAAALRNVELLGRRSAREIASLCHRAAIFAAPARYEPFGLSILEAAMAGCALVLGDIPSLRETWDGAALFVPPDDAGALSTTLRTLVNAPGCTLDLGSRARARAARFTVERMTQDYLQLYRELRTGSLARPAPSLAHCA